MSYANAYNNSVIHCDLFIINVRNQFFNTIYMHFVELYVFNL